jgi:NIPSNAP
MIYVKETLNLTPASPETRDEFIRFATSDLIPTAERLGARLVGAWFGHAEWYGQLTQILEFDDLSRFQSFRAGARDDARWRACEQRVEEFAPQRASVLLEPLGPVPPSTLHDAVQASREKPIDAYTFAVLEVAPGKMDTFIATLNAVKDMFPVIASWRAIAGNPNEVIDLWKGALGQESYQPADDRTKAFFRPLREIAPRERLVNLYALPYSPLR